MASPKSALPSAASTKLKGKVIRLVVQPKVNAKSVHAALDQIFRLSGCTDCGLNGYDVIFHGSVINPAAFNNLANLDGIQNVEVTGGVG